MEVEHQDDILVLIVKNLSNMADSSEVNQLDEWINKSAKNSRYFEQIKNIWDASDRQIDPNMIDTSAALQKVLGRIPETVQKRTIWHYWQKVAAIILLPLTVGTLFWVYTNYNEKAYFNEIVYNEVYTAFGTRTSLRLADSTLVWLNSGSSLRYPNRFNDNNRKVFLKGEAYFEVKSDKSRPFLVQTSTLQVKATGTKFSVIEYDSDPETEITLISGKVAVNESGNNMNPRLISELNPNQHLEYNRETKIKNAVYGDPYRFISWKDGVLMFRDEPLEKVLNKISQFFNVDIELQSEELKSYRYYATFKDESLEGILKLLKLSAPINYTEVKRQPLPDGSFSRKKVIIWLTNN